ncbi:unnamed protein product [Vitrella brassicaformis CCMP3155]|uniref:BTB domain-containing protein n=2 Tax=Vitrella brassicaformis TaxID=1169539 RepID=A0A0G4GDE5_VITBC|nr:unnamed protein product [Vitrella brassicaformis CCMP3155]|eukprot:CEM27340.1 unnamed protein product [Vitrella brassicaformis CCMP3155]
MVAFPLESFASVSCRRQHVKAIVAHPGGDLLAVYNHGVLRISADNEATPLAGGDRPGSADGSGTEARFTAPSSIAVAHDGKVLVTTTEPPRGALRVLSVDEGVTTTTVRAATGGLAIHKVVEAMVVIRPRRTSVSSIFADRVVLKSSDGSLYLSSWNGSAPTEPIMVRDGVSVRLPASDTDHKGRIIFLDDQGRLMAGTLMRDARDGGLHFRLDTLAQRSQLAAAGVDTAHMAIPSSGPGSRPSTSRWVSEAIVLGKSGEAVYLVSSQQETLWRVDLRDNIPASHRVLALLDLPQRLNLPSMNVHLTVNSASGDIFLAAVHREDGSCAIHRIKEDAQCGASCDVEGPTSFMEKMLTSGPFSDVRFVLNNGGELHAHRSVLALRSDYFARMFTSGFCEGQGDETVIEITESRPAVESLLRFMYKGTLELSAPDAHPDAPSADVFEVYCLAHRYDLKGLMTLCLNYIRHRFNKHEVLQPRGLHVDEFNSEGDAAMGSQHDVFPRPCPTACREWIAGGRRERHHEQDKGDPFGEAVDLCLRAHQHGFDEIVEFFVKWLHRHFSRVPEAAFERLQAAPSVLLQLIKRLQNQPKPLHTHHSSTSSRHWSATSPGAWRPSLPTGSHRRASNNEMMPPLRPFRADQLGDDDDESAPMVRTSRTLRRVRPSSSLSSSDVSPTNSNVWVSGPSADLFVGVGMGLGNAGGQPQGRPRSARERGGGDEDRDESVSSRRADM